MNAQSIEQKWFTYFPDAYVVVMSENMSLLREYKVTKDTDIPALYQSLSAMNESRAGIFFTPNKIKDVQDRHKLENLAGYNSWYIDLDISESKGAGTDENLLIREREKRNILEYISKSKSRPSIVNESRNGFHLFWLIGGSPDGLVGQHFSEVERGIAEYFLRYGADTSSSKAVTLLRVPSFTNCKHDETFRVRIRPGMGAVGEDGSPRRYTNKEMIAAFPATPIPEPPKPKIPKYIRIKTQAERGRDIFEVVNNLPIEQVMYRLSGTALVNGETFELKRVGRERLNIFIDGRATGNFIDLPSNYVFGPKGSRGNGPVITQWLSFYGTPWNEMAIQLKQLFL